MGTVLSGSVEVEVREAARHVSQNIRILFNFEAFFVSPYPV